MLAVIKYWSPALLSGLLTVLSSAPYDLWYLGYISFVPMFIAYRQESPGKRGLAYALCCLLVAANWWHSAIIYSAAFFVLIICVLCVSFFIWGYLVASSKLIRTNPFAAIFGPAIIWVGIERILSSELVGVPCNIGISQANVPVFIQSASIMGIYATSFLLVVSNTLISYVLIGLREKLLSGSTRLIAILAGALLLTVNVLTGYLAVNAVTTMLTPLRVSIIQPVIGTDMYLNSWRSPETRGYVKNIISELSVEAAQNSPDLLVWPEGGNGFFNMRIDTLRDFLYRLAIDNKTDLLISSNDLDEEGRKFNSIFSISRQGKMLDRYNKVMLLPGPEDSYTAGEAYTTITSSFGEVGPAICYESNFPSPLRKSTEKGAQLLYVSTSDAAFKKTALTINHTRTAVFRAIENNRWVMHASNTGPSVIVSPRGEIVSQGAMYERGVVNGLVEMISEQSIFTRYGYWIPVLFSVIVLVLLMHQVWLQFHQRRYAQIFSSLGIYTEEEASEAVRRNLSRAVNHVLPGAATLIILVIIVVSSSIIIVFKQVSPEQSPIYAFKEFFTPLDTFVKDTSGDKFLQAKSNTCGPAVLAYIATFFGKEIHENDVIERVKLVEEGTSMLDLKNAAISFGFDAYGVKANYSALQKEPLPAIAYINDSHYVVVNNITNTFVYVFDPALGHVKLPKATFLQAWRGYLLLIRMKEIKTSL